jgi:hypothetical protein
MEVCGHPCTPTALAPTDWDIGWAPELVWMSWRKGKSLPAARNCTMHSPAHSAVTILTELLQLLLNTVKAITDWLLTTQHNFHVIYELKFVLSK